jgi:hypothetical protein
LAWVASVETPNSRRETSPPEQLGKTLPSELSGLRRQFASG